MSWAQIKPWLDTQHGSIALKEHYERYCNWCWYHDLGNCNYCRKEFGKIYRPIRINGEECTPEECEKLMKEIAKYDKAGEQE